MGLFLRTKLLSTKLFSLKGRILATRQMASSNAEYLVNNKKYTFLEELGLRASNYGVYDGSWKGGGQVNTLYNLIFIYLCIFSKKHHQTFKVI